MSGYPELDKVQAVHAESEAIGLFLDWCASNGLTLCKLVKPTEATDYQYHTPVSAEMSMEQLLAAYFDIDLEKIEQEKIAILQELRKGQVS